MKLFENLFIYLFFGVIFLKDGIAQRKGLLMSWEHGRGPETNGAACRSLSLQGLDDTERGAGGFGSTGKNWDVCRRQEMKEMLFS